MIQSQYVPVGLAPETETRRPSFRRLVLRAPLATDQTCLGFETAGRSSPGVLMRKLFLVGFFLFWPGMLPAPTKITPTPQYMEALPRPLKPSPEDRLVIHVGPSAAVDQEKMALAADYLRRDLIDAVPNMRTDVERFGAKSPGP